MCEIRYSFVLFLCCFPGIRSLFPIVIRERLYNYIPPEAEVTFHLYHRQDLSRDDRLMPSNITSIKDSRFDPDLPTKILIHGWTHGKDVPWLKEMREAMASTGLWNIIVVDWSNLSRVVYIEARLHTYTVAKELKKLILSLTEEVPVDILSLHLIGHSMGAQISGRVGHLLNKETGQKVSRITGLDPAAPLYEWPHMESYDDVLDPSDALFVDVIHTNAKHIGVINPSGHVDYYPNGGKRQNGCNMWSCSHLRACEFWTASIRKPDLFKAFPFQRWYEYLQGKRKNLTVYPMGIAANPNMPFGLYYLDPNDEYKMYLAYKTVLLVADPKAAGERKFILKEDKYNATNFMTLWEFEGILKYSPLFYGWYTNNDNKKGYWLPFAYFITGLVVYAYSFIATLRKMAENSRVSKLSEKDDECIFSWKLFTGWDYMIGNAETAHNRVASIVMGFKEALLEEAEKKKDTRNWKVISFRILVNILILGLLAFSVFAVVMVVDRSTQPDVNSSFWRKSETPVVMSIITMVFPFLFEILGFLEQYHPRKQLRLQLARIMVLNLLNLYSLIFALIVKIGGMTKELEVFKNLTERSNAFNSVELTTINYINSQDCTILCYSLEGNTIDSDSLIKELAYNISTTALPKLAQFVNFLHMQLPNDTEVDNYTYTTEFFDYNNFTEEYNLTYGNESIFNGSFEDTSKFDIQDLTYTFIDYLTYILHSYVGFNETVMVETFNESTTMSTTSDLSFTENFDTFKSTVMPFIAKTSKTVEFNDVGRFDYELSTLYEEVTSTIASLKENCTKICENVRIPLYKNVTSVTLYDPEQSLNYTMKSRLRNLCWETIFGQELIRLTMVDLVMTIASTLSMDFFRGIFVRVMNRCWCWDLEKVFPQYGDFKVAENILSLVNNQGMVWMGMFFSPGLVLLNVIKLYIMMYFRAWAVLTCNVPHEVIFRASRSNNFYYALLLMMLFLCVLPVGYAIVWIKPSWHCGPFSSYQKIFHIFTLTIRDTTPKVLQRVLDYIASPALVIPLLLLLVLIIYYLVSLTSALRGANEELKIQLRRERTEERRKMFQLVDRRRRGGSGESNETPFNKWKKLIGNLQGTKSLDDTPRQENEEVLESVQEEKNENKSKDFFSKLLKLALRKSSTSEDEQNDQNAGDATDTEQHDSLPEDPAVAIQANKKPRPSWGSFEFRDIANKALRLKKSLESGSKGGEYSENTNQDQTKSSQTNIKKNLSEMSESSTSRTQDSDSSVWSDIIPVITISKTESAENILCENKFQTEINTTKQSRFHPKVRCVLRKQSTEIDEDTVRYFNNDLEKNISECKAVKKLIQEDYNESLNAEEDSITSQDFIEDFELCAERVRTEETDKSSSDETEQKDGSVETILNFSTNTEPEN